MQRSVAQSFQLSESISFSRSAFFIFPPSESRILSQPNVSVKNELLFLLSSPVLHRQLWGDGKDLIGPRSQCQRAGQWAVDAAARRRHLWPCGIGHHPYCIVRCQKSTSHSYQTLIYQLQHHRSSSTWLGSLMCLPSTAVQIFWPSTPMGTCPTTCVKTTQRWTS